MIFEEIRKKSPQTETSAIFEKQIFKTTSDFEQHKTEPEVFTKSEEQIKTKTNENVSTDIEKSRVWYEDRYQELKPRKKDYPPYI